MAAGDVPVPDKQREKIKELLNIPNSEGDTNYLVQGKWWNAWRIYVGWFDNVPSPNNHPGVIDNHVLLSKDKLRPHLAEDIDYTLLPRAAWELMVQWFGGGPPLPRKVICVGLAKSKMVEVYPLNLKILRANFPGVVKDIEASKAEKLSDFKKRACELLGVPPDRVEGAKAFNFYGGIKYAMMEADSTLDEARLANNQQVLIDDAPAGPQPAAGAPAAVQGSSSSSFRPQGGGIAAAPAYPAGAQQPRQPLGSSGQNVAGGQRPAGQPGSQQPGSNGYAAPRAAPAPAPYPAQPMYSDIYREPGRVYAAGAMGLQNLGNTCFMNSALQCMSNTASLTRYLVDGRHVDEINRENPLGMKGEVAMKYADLVRDLWSGKGSSIAPREFKYVIGKFAPRFMGYMQQDSQEFLAYLLDGLHEDLNRRRVKPYVEMRDAEGRPDEEVADEAWDNHKKRNDSVIVDLFQGQFRSTVVCPIEDCRTVSVTFDPFMFLSVPMPVKTTRAIRCIVNFADPARAQRVFGVTVEKRGRVEDLLRALGAMTGIAPDCLVIAEVYNGRFYTTHEASKSLDQLRENEEFAVFEVQSKEQRLANNLVLVKVSHRYKKIMNSNYHPSYSYDQNFGNPLIMAIPKDLTYRQFEETLRARMARHLVVPEAIPEAVRPAAPPREKTPELEQKLFIVKYTHPTTRTVTDLPSDDAPCLPNIQDNQEFQLEWHEKLFAAAYGEDRLKAMREEDASAAPVAGRERERGVSLHECIHLFTTMEKLGAEDPWRCPKCKDFREASKKFDLWRMPKVLVVHLKRFSYNRWSRDKLETFVDFPIEGLDLSQHLEESRRGQPCVYDLFAVSNHYGGMGGGHYTAYAKNKDSGEWYNFDDSHAQKVAAESVVTRSAYVLFYELREPGAPVPRAAAPAPPLREAGGPGSNAAPAGPP